MSAYLYIWNPKKWVWSDRQDAIYRVNNDDKYDMPWSCGNTKRAAIGDIFFLMRLGIEPKGIIGCGYISSTPYRTSHWDVPKAAEGKSALRTDLLFKALREEPFLSLPNLQRLFPDYTWTPQAGGLSIPDEIAHELFSIIQNDETFGFPSSDKQYVQLFAEGKPRSLTYTTYDRSPAARRACIEHHGYNCSVCDFNFEKSYGELGARYIEVHHLKQIADVKAQYEIDPTTDLRPVCANCHRMLHKNRPPLSIEELRSYKR